MKFFVAAASFAALLFASTAQAAPASPCRDAPNGTALDFWVGTWKVTAAGAIDGHNRIERTLDGCALIENWEGTTAGDVGKSLFTYDARSHRWAQIWVRPDTTPAGGIVHADLVAIDAGGAAHFDDTTFGPKGLALLQRTTLAPLKDGTVRQLIEQSRDGGATWAAAYDALYSREPDSAYAMTPPVPNDPMPCRASPQGKALDFWVGDWNVIAVAGGAKQGDSRIERVLDGCAILEHWHGATPGDNGKSLFAFNAGTTLWDQVWVTSDTSRPGGLKNKHEVATWPDGAIRFQGTIFVRPGAVVLDRTTLTPLPDGRVRQTIEWSKDGGTNWSVSFDAYYIPKTAPSPPRSGGEGGVRG
jgi:hypothetical protein